jgi:4-oxalocrotonate tautomerase
MEVNMSLKKLDREFYNRDSVIVAKELLGKLLVHKMDGRRVSARIVEAEAYMGITDKAAHSYGGKRTPRVEEELKGEILMPYVNIRITNEGVTPEKKEQLIKGATQLLVDVLGKNPNTTFVVIDEVDTDNWGIAGETITARRKKGQ